MSPADIADRKRMPVIWNETELPDDLKEKPRIGDKAYLGAKKPTATPKKKPKGGELTEAEKAENKLISQARIYVEHSIRKVKGFRVVRDEYRLAQGIFPTVVAPKVILLANSILPAFLPHYLCKQGLPCFRYRNFL